MPNVLNHRMLSEVRSHLEGATDCVIVDFTGVSVAEVSDMRATLRKSSIRMKVVKTSLAQRAARDLGFEGADDLFKGATAIVYGGESVAAVAKSVDDLAKAKKEKAPRVRGGILGKRAIGPSEVTRLAQMPSREQLLAELVAAFVAPLSGLAGAMQTLLGDFPSLTQALHDKGGAAGEAAPG